MVETVQLLKRCQEGSIVFCVKPTQIVSEPPHDSSSLRVLCANERGRGHRLTEAARIGSEDPVRGMSLIPLLKLRLAAPRFLVDINRLPGMSYIIEADGFLKIGALTREADVERSELVRSKCPILSDTASVIGDPLVRNMATIAGNLAHGDPANDHPATMLALRAQVVATGPNGERKIPIGDFFTGLFTTVLSLTNSSRKSRSPFLTGSGGAYIKLERKVGDFATAAVAAQLTVARGDVCERVGIGLTNAGPNRWRTGGAEDALQGKKIDGETIRRAAGTFSAQRSLTRNRTCVVLQSTSVI